MPTVTLNAGIIDYEKSGRDDGRPVVFVDGYAMGRSLWEPLVERLATRVFLCIAPTRPLGAHAYPMRKDAELTIEAIAAMVGELLDELSLEDAVLVGNDTGGAIAQVVATTTPARFGKLVDELRRVRALPTTDPQAAHRRRDIRTRVLGASGRRTRIGRQRAYGALALADIDHLVSDWLKPALGDRGVREDLRRLTASLQNDRRPSRPPRACPVSQSPR